MVQKVWAALVRFHYGSATVFWSHVLAWVGVVIEGLYQFPDVAQAVGLAQYVPPVYLGKYTLAIALITLAARLRTCRRQ